MLINAAIEHPWFGVGHADDRLRYGVTKDGHIAYKGNAAASSESGLRMWAKYGSIYYLFLLVFITLPIYRAFRGLYRDNIFVISISGIILITGIGGTLFENLYNINGLFTIVLLFFSLSFSRKVVRKGRPIIGSVVEVQKWGVR